MTRHYGLTPAQALIRFANADRRWSQALRQKFGARAGDMRYQPQGVGEPGTELRALHDIRMDAQSAWYEVMGAEGRP